MDSWTDFKMYEESAEILGVNIDKGELPSRTIGKLLLSMAKDIEKLEQEVEQLRFNAGM